MGAAASTMRWGAMSSVKRAIARLIRAQVRNCPAASSAQSCRAAMRPISSTCRAQKSALASTSPSPKPMENGGWTLSRYMPLAAMGAPIHVLERVRAPSASPMIGTKTT